MIRRINVVVAVTAGLLVSVLSGVSLGSVTTVTQAIQAQDNVVQSNPGYKVVGELSTLKLKSDSQAEVLIKQLNELELAMKHAGVVVGQASATTGQQKTGQAEWLGGLKAATSGVGSLSAALTDVIEGKKSAASTAMSKVESEDLAATKLTNEGDKLLGLPAGD